MWGARGARLWRSLERTIGGRGSQEPALRAAESSLRNVSSEAGSVPHVASAKSVGGSSVNGGAVAWRCRGWQQPREELAGASKPLYMLQQHVSIVTRAESLRASSDVDRSTGGLQKEPILRPKDVDAEEDVDEEPLEESNVDSEIQSVESSSLEAQLQNAPRRKQRFLLQKALKMRNVEVEGRPQKRGFTMKVVDVNRTCKVTKGGGILNFTALVICGNGDGVAGFGKGKSAEISAAVDKAYARALRNLHYFERFEGHTIFHEKTSKYGKTKIYLWPAQSGTGMRASHTVGGILRLAGFKDVKTKVVGSRHPHNTVKAVFQALSEIETPEETAEREGRERVMALHS